MPRRKAPPKRKRHVVDVGKLRKKPLKKVIAQNRMRTEYKDRVAIVYTDPLANSFKGTPATGPSNSRVILPYALLNKWQQGSANGQIDGNSINARFLNMKVELEFNHLPVYVTSNGVTNVPCHYDIRVRQCLIMEDIGCFFDQTYTNASSGRQQRTLTDDGSTTGTQAYLQTARQKLFQNGLDADFLSYEKRQDSKVRILRTERIKFDLNDRLGDGIQAAMQAPTPHSRPKRFSFNWKMPSKKTQMYPVVNTDDPQDFQVTGYTPGKMWIPCILVTMDRSVADDDQSGDHKLNMRYTSHFTYTDQ